jgi:hypothetical protein
MNSAPSKIAASVAQFDRHAASFQANHLEPLLSRLRSLHAAADELHPEAARQCRAVVDEQAALAIFLLAELMADPLTAADYARGRSDGGAWPEVVDTSYGSKIATYTSGSGAVR